MSTLKTNNIEHLDATSPSIVVNAAGGIQVGGALTATTGTFSGNVSVAGVLSYEDVTNIDSVGIITANAGIDISNTIVSNNDSTIRYDNDTFIIDVDSNNVRGSSAFKVNVDTVNALTIDDNRKIGINDTTPENTLSIKNIGSFDGDANSFYLGSNFTGTGQNFSGSGKHAQRFFFNNASSNGYLSYSNTGATGTAGDAITWQERLRITSGGNVGINESAPDVALMVSADSGVKIHAKSANTTAVLELAGTRSAGAAAVAISKIKSIPENPTGNSDDTSLAFETRSQSGGMTEAMRITSSTDGRLLIGTVNGSVSSGPGIKLTGGGAASVNIVTNAASNINVNHVYNINATRNGYRYYLSIDGGIRNFSNSNVNLSDEREKKNIVDMDSTWSELKQWTLRQFHFNDQDDSEDKCYGVIAQQVETVSPQVLSTFETNPTTTRKGVKEQKMMWMAIKALQEAMAKIETLEAKVQALEES